VHTKRLTCSVRFNCSIVGVHLKCRHRVRKNPVSSQFDELLRHDSTNG